jgi:hypothetical protein
MFGYRWISLSLCQYKLRIKYDLENVFIFISLCFSVNIKPPRLGNGLAFVLATLESSILYSLKGPYQGIKTFNISKILAS